MFDQRLLPKNLKWQVPGSHRQGPVGIGKSFYSRFFITYRINEPVMYETDNAAGDFAYSNRMTWKVKNRNYYKKGDLVLYGQMDQKWMMKSFSSLSSQKGSESFLQTIIDSEILGPSSMSKYAFVIWDIEPILNRPGYGIINLKPIVFFGETAVFLIDEPCRTYTVQQLSDNASYHEAAQAMLDMLPLLYATMEIVQIVLTGGAKSALSKSASVYVVRKASIKAVTKVAEKQARNVLLKKMAEKAAIATLPATLAFATEFLGKLTIQQEESLRKMAENSESINYHVFESALHYGMQAFVFTFINECLGSVVGKMVEQFEISGALKTFLIQKLISFPKAIVNTILTAYRKADEDRKRNRLGNKPPKNILNKYIADECLDVLKNAVKDAFKQLTSI